MRRWRARRRIVVRGYASPRENARMGSEGQLTPLLRAERQFPRLTRGPRVAFTEMSAPSWLERLAKQE